MLLKRCGKLRGQEYYDYVHGERISLFCGGQGPAGKGKYCAWTVNDI
jgi:hypothetical protein